MPIPDSDAFRSLLDAIAFAGRAHHGQMRKDGRTPYFSHVVRVCTIVRNIFGFDDPRMLTTAVLHDVIEDTTTDFDDVAKNFGIEIANWVALLSKDKRLQEEHRERAYIEGLQSAPWQVRICKLADVYDNLLDSVNLPKDRVAHTIDRVASYIAALEGSTEPQLRQPLALVKELMVHFRKR